jgi:BlaI family penicillinase repressor
MRYYERKTPNLHSPETHRGRTGTAACAVGTWPSTVREIHENLGAEKETGYTTTLKILQKMAEKGLVTRDETDRTHIYAAAIKAEQTQRQLVRDLVHRAFGGSPMQLVVQALSEQKASPAELAEIRRLLDSLESTNHKS